MDEPKTGLELNLAVARVVFKLEPVLAKVDWFRDGPFERCSDPEDCPDYSYSQSDEWLVDNHTILPDYSGRIAAAWTVVELMKQRGLTVWVISNAEGVKIEVGQHRPIVFAVARSEPEAICKVALEALASDG